MPADDDARLPLLGGHEWTCLSRPTFRKRSDAGRGLGPEASAFAGVASSVRVFDHHAPPAVPLGLYHPGPPPIGMIQMEHAVADAEGQRTHVRKGHCSESAADSGRIKGAVPINRVGINDSRGSRPL